MLIHFEFLAFSPISFKIDFLFLTCVDHVQKAAKDTVSEKDRSNTNKELAYEKFLTSGIINKCS